MRNPMFSTQTESPRTWDIPSMPVADRLGPRANGHRAADAHTLSARAVCHYIKVEPESNIISYTGPGSLDTEAAAIRTAESIPRDCPLYYFEVEILNQGASGCIGVGVMEAHVHLHRLPGWEACSYGYHGDDGNIFHGEGKGKPYGHKYTTGDIIGVCVDCVQRTISFYKNGMCRGVAFRDITTAPLYPCVGFRSQDAKVCVNLGAQPFRHGVSLEALKADVTALVAEQIGRATIPPSPGSAVSPISLAILDHLIHTCCWKTAQAVARDLLGSCAAPPSSGALLSDDDVHMMCVRLKLRQLVESGDAMEARGMLEEVCPGLLASRPDVAFTLELQCFVELLRSGSPAAQAAALKFARSSLRQLELDNARQEQLREALALLAYDDPLESPSAFLFQQERRVACAADVNGAIMQHQGRQGCSAVESLYAQLEVVRAELVASGAVAAQLLSMKDVLTHGLQRCAAPSLPADPDSLPMQE